MRSSTILSVLVGLLLCFFETAALAHIQITFPPPREGTSTPQLKDQPCGTSGVTRSTIPARISTFQPGQTITVRWTETIGHPGHFRIAFLQNGNAFADPTSFTDIQATPVLPILKDGIPSSGVGGTQFMMAVTLPNVECNNCTLQVIQVMTDKPPFGPSPPLGLSPPGDDVYHQCADIVLSAAGADAGGGAGAGGARPDGGASTGAGGAGTSGAGTGGAATGSGGAGVGTTTGGSGGGLGSGGTTTTGANGTTTGGTAGSSVGTTTGSSGANGNPGVSPAANDMGCACRFVRPARAERPLALLVALALGGGIRRRRRSLSARATTPTEIG